MRFIDEVRQTEAFRLRLILSMQPPLEVPLTLFSQYCVCLCCGFRLIVAKYPNTAPDQYCLVCSYCGARTPQAPSVEEATEIHQRIAQIYFECVDRSKAIKQAGLWNWQHEAGNVAPEAAYLAAKVCHLEVENKDLRNEVSKLQCHIQQLKNDGGIS